MKKITIAIDGFSGTGKSSTAKEVAKQLAYTYIDSGAMYRACTLYFLDKNIDPRDENQVVAALGSVEISFQNGHILLNGLDVSDEIRTMRVNDHVSEISASLKVRNAMVNQQRMIGDASGIVMDGRDIGTVVFPEADLKVFMTANSKVRAQRRQAELEKKGVFEELSVIESNLLKRDQMDSSREESPLKKAEGAIEIDTSNINFKTQVQEIVSLAKSILYEG